MQKIVAYLCLGIISIFAVIIIDMSDYVLSCLYCALALFSIKLIWDKSEHKITLFMVFVLSYNVFIGGRFIVYLFSQRHDIFVLTFFSDYIARGSERISIFLYVYLLLFMSTIGYYAGWDKKRKVRFVPKQTINTANNINKVLLWVFPVLAVVTLYNSLVGLTEAWIHGYAAMGIDESASNNISYVRKFANMAVSIFAGMSIAYGNTKSRKYYLGLLLLTSIFSILGGSRGALGAVLMFALWAYSRYRKMNIKKLFLYSIGGLTIMLFLFSVSVRAVTYGYSDMSMRDAFEDFFYSNGGSLMIFGVSMTVSNYPVLPYFQTFITGANVLYSLLWGVTVTPETLSFQGHLCNTLNSALFYSGAGLGWTVNGDLFLFSGRNIFVYSILAYLLGRFLSYIDVCSFKSSFYLFVAGSLCFGIAMMPRGSLSALFAMIPYIYLFYYLVIFLGKVKGSKSIYLK